MPILGYNKWQNFHKVIKQAMIACDNSKNKTNEHFTEASKVLTVGNGAKQKVKDYRLSRYACYLIAQNADSRKKLRYREDILDNMCSEELADNLFRIVQTESKIKNENIEGENNSCKAHYNMGRAIRNFIKKQGGTMPEDLPTPKKSLKELENNNKIIDK